jgi:curved DNA-binding protein CbpA
VELWKSLERIDGEDFPSPIKFLERSTFINGNDYESYYQLLGIPSSASFSQIKKAYRLKASEFHPDKGGSEDDFSKISTAYSVLSSPTKRHEYDNSTSKKSSLLLQAQAGNVKLPIIDPVVSVGAPRYTYYQGKGEKADYDVVLEWYGQMVDVFNLFGIEDRPRVAVHSLGKAYSWSKINSKFQIAHFDKTIQPSFIVALAATLQSEKIKLRNENGI